MIIGPFIFTASASISFLHIGSLKAFGLFFVEFLEMFDASVSVTSLIVSIQNVFYALIGELSTYKFNIHMHAHFILILQITLTFPLYLNQWLSCNHSFSFACTVNRDTIFIVKKPLFHWCHSVYISLRYECVRNERWILDIHSQHSIRLVGSTI